ncbi:ABC transporter ATP-binding protein [Methanobacterium sp. ACI-7]|uniref:ABC transporter ATP-binding protein n=1 Tax=unclassified Methanobacterium TaxID=2627676 RepID=UPI0039C09AD2
MSNAIETKGLTKRFALNKSFKELLTHQKKEFLALEDVNIKVKKGELFSILGFNGAGKTTLIKILCTLILPDEGKAFVNGYDVVENDEKVKKCIGHINSEERSFYWRLTGRQNLQFYGSLHDISNSELDKRINEVLRIVKLQDKADYRFDSYSTGMKNRMAIARGLINNPDILFLDEPTKSMDPYNAQKFREFIKEELIEDQEKTIFMATHNLDEAEQLSDRIAIINDGKIEAYGKIDKLFKSIEKYERIVVEAKNISERVLNEIESLNELINVSCISRQPDYIKIEMIISNKDIISKIMEIMVVNRCKVRDFKINELQLNDLFAHFTHSVED